MMEELLLRRMLEVLEAPDDPPSRKVRVRLRSLDAPWMEVDPDAVWCTFGKAKTSLAGRNSTHQSSALAPGSTEVAAIIAAQLKRIADHFDPPPPDIVDSVYVAQKVGCTTTWIADQARNGRIPEGCLVPGTGDGKPWKFYRDKIDRWIESR